MKKRIKFKTVIEISAISSPHKTVNKSFLKDEYFNGKPIMTSSSQNFNVYIGLEVFSS